MTPLEISGSLYVLGDGLATRGPGTIMQPVYIGFAIVEALAILGFVLAFVIR